jgi:hypothetical protein
MIARGMLVRISLVLSGILGAGSAFAEPYFAVQMGLKCAACHANATGGGLRNAFGDTWAQTIMPAKHIDVPGVDTWTGSVNRFVSLGANLRANGTFVDTPNQSSTNEFDVQEARLYVELSAIPDRLSVYLDQRVAPGGSANLEAYGRFWFNDRKWYVKAGQMYLPYGIRFEDDSAFVREVPGINMDTPDRGVELGLETTHWSVQFAISNGTSGGSEQDQGKQYSARAEYVQSLWRLGASANLNSTDTGERKAGNLFAGLRTGPVAWLAEADFIDDDSTGVSRKQRIGLLEANWLVMAGHNLKLTAEYLDPNDDVDENERNRYSLVWEVTPVQFLQVRIGARIYDGIPQNDNDNRKVGFVQVNAFF